MMIMNVTLAVLLLQQPAPPSATPPAQIPPGLETQVALDRAGFSPGAIDGKIGRNTRRALALFQQQGGQQQTAVEVLTNYTITDEDVRGPFVPSIPEDMIQKAKLADLGYTSVLEALAERFHSTPALLKQLNPNVAFDAGATIHVPNVEALVRPAEQAPTTPEAAGQKNAANAKTTGTSGRGTAKAVSDIMSRPDVVVTVTSSTSDLVVKDSSGKILMYAPVTTGSEHDPLPIGEWKVNGIQFNPKFRYNPDLFWDADPSHSKATLPPGPNSPVGLVWIDLSKPHYGIHGTPEPSTIGKTESHGCVRLTNWDVLKLAGLVKPGTRVVFAQ
jgi:lipoprotein-anchoring transpeptidase ErfK/SrfK